MFGNLKGWLISLVMFAVTGFLIYSTSKAPQASSVTTVKSFAVAMKPVKMEFDYTALFPPGTEEKDAGEQIIALEDEAHNASLRNWFEKLDKAMDVADPAKRDKARRDAVKPLEPMLDRLVAASKCTKMTLCKPQEIVVYDNKPYLKYLVVLGKKASVAGRAYWTSGNAEEKQKGHDYIVAAFHLGRLLFQDRQIVKEYSKGLEIMTDAAFNLGVVDSSKKKQCEDLTNAIEALRSPAAMAYGVIANPNENSAPGEIFLIAKNKEAEPMWRVEAILKLGRMRWLKGVEYADQKEANKVLGEIAAEPNLPANVKVAVDVAQKLTAADMSNLFDREP